MKNRFCSGLQDFTPKERHYDVIWCQWVLGHLKDDDLVQFFQRCKKGLSENGLIFVKENVTSEDREFDSEDSSYARSLSDLRVLMKKAGLEIICDKKQKDFPKLFIMFICLLCNNKRKFLIKKLKESFLTFNSEINLSRNHIISVLIHFHLTIC